ncbi:MAG TPA: class I SAM-dependent methyltransferase [Mucilaginibacter sp.]|nr:class I SAM-dependent methyltransferase [Mucilaginibacter sp.]
MKDFRCSVCDNNIGNTMHIAREMMLGLREQFLYFQCSQCGCLQIAEAPQNMQPYYPADNYYSFRLTTPKQNFKSKLALFLRKFFLKFYLKKNNALSSCAVRFLLRNKEYKWITQLKGLKLSSDILDIGSGIGLLLLELKKNGFEKLTGIDPYVEKDIHHQEDVTIFKKNIDDINKRYDLVMLNHVFEHLPNPGRTFEQLYKLLKPGGWLLIRVPVADCFCWRKYGVSWYQLDAPRHFFLHTIKSMSILAGNNGLSLLSVRYDSDERQFLNSEKYIRNKTLFEDITFDAQLRKKWEKHAKWLNSVNDGDQACLIFSKISKSD